MPEQIIDSPEILNDNIDAKTMKRNMVLCIIYTIMAVVGGNCGLSLALYPLLVHLDASNTIIGVVRGGTFAALPGIFLAPWISRKFRIKKWLIIATSIIVWIPCILIGLFTLYQVPLNISNIFLIGIIVSVWLFSFFAYGFIMVAQQEMIASSIYKSHIGRYQGLSTSLSNAVGIGATTVGGLVLAKLPEPESYGYIALWGSIISLFAFFAFAFLKEKPSDIENAPTPWSTQMIRSALENKPFIRILIANSLATMTYISVGGFIIVYALKDLHIQPAKVAIIALISQIMGLIASAPTGFIVDRFGCKKLIPATVFGVLLSVIILIIFRNEWGVYISVAIGNFCGIVTITAVNTLYFILPKAENRTGHYTLQVLSSNIALAAGPIFVGRMFDVFTYQPVFIATAVLVILFYPLFKWAVVSIPDDVHSSKH